MAKFITAKEAAQLIPDHATVGVAGMDFPGGRRRLPVRSAIILRRPDIRVT